MASVHGSPSKTAAPVNPSLLSFALEGPSSDDSGRRGAPGINARATGAPPAARTGAGKGERRRSSVGSVGEALPEATAGDQSPTPHHGETAASSSPAAGGLPHRRRQTPHPKPLAGAQAAGVAVASSSAIVTVDTAAAAAGTPHRRRQGGLERGAGSNRSMRSQRSVAKLTGEHSPGRRRMSASGGQLALAAGGGGGGGRFAPSYAKDRNAMRWEERVTLCLNKPLQGGAASAWEVAFQRDMGHRWRQFVRTSIVLLVVVIALFAIQDWYKYGPSSSWPDKEAIWRGISVARYGVLTPVLLAFLPVTYMRRFRSQWWFTQASTGGVMLIIGLVVVALSSIGQDPGYGVLALYLVYAVNVSLLGFAFRFAILTFVITIFIAVTLSYNGNDISPQDAAFACVYLATFFFGELGPVLLREHAVRQNYFRRFRIDIERRKLAEEQAKTSRLLLNMLPSEIVPRLRNAGGLGRGPAAPGTTALAVPRSLSSAAAGPRRELIADSFDEVTILWTDMKGFTDFSAARSPLEIVAFLNAMFSTFDRILDKYGVRKIEVLGDAFFCCSGVPTHTPDHAERCANAALEMLMHMPILRRFAGADISMRIGIHTGPVIAGVVGMKDPRYHLFGDSVPYANAMESHGVPGAIHISEPSFRRLAERQAERARDFVGRVKRSPPALPGGLTPSSLTAAAAAAAQAAGLLTVASPAVAAAAGGASGGHRASGFATASAAGAGAIAPARSGIHSASAAIGRALGLGGGTAHASSSGLGVGGGGSGAHSHTASRVPSVVLPTSPAASGTLQLQLQLVSDGGSSVGPDALGPAEGGAVSVGGSGALQPQSHALAGSLHTHTLSVGSGLTLAAAAAAPAPATASGSANASAIVAGGGGGGRITRVGSGLSLLLSHTLSGGPLSPAPAAALDSSPAGSRAPNATAAAVGSLALPGGSGGLLPGVAEEEDIAAVAEAVLATQGSYSLGQYPVLHMSLLDEFLRAQQAQAQQQQGSDGQEGHEEDGQGHGAAEQQRHDSQGHHPTHHDAHHRRHNHHQQHQQTQQQSSSGGPSARRRSGSSSPAAVTEAAAALPHAAAALPAAEAPPANGAAAAAAGGHASMSSVNSQNGSVNGNFLSKSLHRMLSLQILQPGAVRGGPLAAGGAGTAGGGVAGPLALLSPGGTNLSGAAAATLPSSSTSASSGTYASVLPAIARVLLPQGIHPTQLGVRGGGLSNGGLSGHPAPPASLVHNVVQTLAQGQTAYNGGKDTHAAAAAAAAAEALAGGDGDGANTTTDGLTRREITGGGGGSEEQLARRGDAGLAARRGSSARALARASHDDDGALRIAESGDAAVRGQLQLWRGTAFLGWDIESDMVQGAMLYADIPCVPEQTAPGAPPGPSAAALAEGLAGGVGGGAPGLLLTAVPAAPAHAAGVSAARPPSAASALHDASPGLAAIAEHEGAEGAAGAGSQLSVASRGSGGAAGGGRLQPFTSAFAPGSVARDSATSAAAAAAAAAAGGGASLAALRVRPPLEALASVGSPQEGGATAGGSSVTAGDASPAASSSLGSSSVVGSPQQQLQLLPAAVTVTVQTPGAPPGTQAQAQERHAQPSVPPLHQRAMRSSSLFASALHLGGLASSLASGVHGRAASALGGGTAGAAGAGAPGSPLPDGSAPPPEPAPIIAMAAEAIPVTLTASGCYLPADPSALFGPGGGFFAFEARDIEVKGRGMQRTHFLTRADPPFLPEVAAPLAQLQERLHAWAEAHFAALPQQQQVQAQAQSAAASPAAPAGLLQDASPTGAAASLDAAAATAAAPVQTAQTESDSAHTLASTPSVAATSDAAAAALSARLSEAASSYATADTARGVATSTAGEARVSRSILSKVRDSRGSAEGAAAAAVAAATATGSAASVGSAGSATAPLAPRAAALSVASVGSAASSGIAAAAAGVGASGGAGGGGVLQGLGLAARGGSPDNGGGGGGRPVDALDAIARGRSSRNAGAASRNSSSGRASPALTSAQMDSPVSPAALGALPLGARALSPSLASPIAPGSLAAGGASPSPAAAYMTPSAVAGWTEHTRGPSGGAGALPAPSRRASNTLAAAGAAAAAAASSAGRTSNLSSGRASRSSTHEDAVTLLGGRASAGGQDGSGGRGSALGGGPAVDPRSVTHMTSCSEDDALAAVLSSPVGAPSVVRVLVVGGGGKPVASMHMPGHGSHGGGHARAASNGSVGGSPVVPTGRPASSIGIGPGGLQAGAAERSPAAALGSASPAAAGAGIASHGRRSSHSRTSTGTSVRLFHAPAESGVVPVGVASPVPSPAGGGFASRGVVDLAREYGLESDVGLSTEV
jgi:class 3 adenylate cyclase